ncbi:MAG: hypothetical protein U1E73_08835 [Planctomycetota bacterium]
MTLPSAAAAALALAACAARPLPGPSTPRELLADGGWCWFQDERALVLDDRYVVFGSVADGRGDASRAGDVQASRWDLATGAVETVVLHARLDRDDHAAPAFFRRDDGRLLTTYCTHGHDDVLRWRFADPCASPFAFEPERTFTVPLPKGHGLTYSNLLLSCRGGGSCIPEAIVDVCRAENWNPTALASYDGGASWQVAQRVVAGVGRPYAKYAGDGTWVHFVCTEQHPRDFDNGLSYGRFVATSPTQRGDGEMPDTELEGGHFRGPAPDQLTPVFAGRPDAVAWPCDLELGADGQPVCVFSVQVDGAGKPRGEGGLDHRFWYGRFDGTRWHTHEIAFAGTKLYAGEDDYTGLCCLVPDEPTIVIASTDADPVTGAPLRSRADGKRHHELFLGRTADGGASWTWTALTRDSTGDNLRPIVPRWRRDRCVLLWLAGELRTYTDYDLAVRGQVLAL